MRPLCACAYMRGKQLGRSVLVMVLGTISLGGVIVPSTKRANTYSILYYNISVVSTLLLMVRYAKRVKVMVKSTKRQGGGV